MYTFVFFTSGNCVLYFVCQKLHFRSLSPPIEVYQVILVIAYFDVPTRPGTKLSSNRSIAAMSLVRIHLRQKHRLKAPCAFSSLKSPSNNRYQTNPAVGKAKARRSDCCLLIRAIVTSNCHSSPYCHLYCGGRPVVIDT